ncbi:putative membrane protein [Nocardia nova SH22a]|uniref:Putative membrane protein n=1 Tax=Nocardia nova SH22a TaxID=1415166 RepID=W5T6S2_9NOCA|nr:alpha/beta-hydrolase family protein [Nocardia nova]AHH14867.1 putative membrane protein [Nocardia nova SH22a]
MNPISAASSGSQDRAPAAVDAGAAVDAPAAENTAAVPAASGRPARGSRERPGSSFTGAVLAVVMVWLSLTPSLLPRGQLFQGLVTGAAATIGYALGAALAAVAVWSLHRDRGRPVPAWVWGALVVVALSGTVTMFILFAHWQRELRDLMGVSGLRWYAYPLIVLVAAAVFLVLVGIGRMVRVLCRWAGRGLGRFLPPRIAVVGGAVLVVALIVALLNGVVAQGSMSALNDMFKAVDSETVPDTTAPTASERSGGPGSLVSWDSLGRQGRIFVSAGPTVAQLSAFNGRPAREPVRAYTGLASGPSIRADAELAVADLDRAGGFGRSVLAVATTTGTGWINESTASALEYLYNGDTAIVSMQYSYLPSWISFMVDQERARQAGRALFDAVYARWTTMPRDHRPKLVVFGESLGSFGGEAAFSGIGDITARTDGVLFVGPPNSNVLWGELTARRDPGSPEWLPVYDRGRNVHFVARPPDLDHPAPPWNSPRVVYLQHPSDPITWWSPHLLFDEPDWLREPRGYDVLPSTRWIPVVTFLQVSADMAVSTDVPDGHGHTFHAAVADSWAAILQPPGWTTADTLRLRAVLTGD